MENKTERVGVVFTKRQMSMIEQIAPEIGVSTVTAVLERGMELLYAKTFPAYSTRQAGGKQKEKTTLKPEQIAVNKVEAKALEKKAEQERKEKEKSTICIRELYGRVEDDGNGNKYCIFPTHTTENTSEMKIPLLQSSPIIAKTSIWMPSKEAVLKARPDLKKTYGKSK